MNKIAEQLRTVAALVARDDGFICHTLADIAPNDQGRWIRTPGTVEARSYAALRFLKALGMPLDGGGFQSWAEHCEGARNPERPEDQVPQETLRELRATWCEFAAHLAESWRVTAKNVHKFEEPQP